MPLLPTLPSLSNLPKLVVINLPESQTRRLAMQEHLAQFQLSCDFFAAVNGKQLSATEIAAVYDAEKARTTEWGELTRGEIGCALSHRGVWQTLIDSGDQGWLVLEDDAVLADDIREWLPLLPSLVANGELVPLVSTSSTPYFFRRTAIAARWLVYPNQAFIAATAYYITPLAAERLLRASSPIWFPIDIWYSTPGFKGVTPIRALWPAAVFPRDAHIDASTIGKRHAHQAKISKEKSYFRQKISRLRLYLKNRFFLRPVRFK